MSRPKHPNKHIEEALKYAEDQGWRVEKAGKSAHAWGRIYCGGGQREDCIISVWSTPRSPQNHAQQIRRAINKCPHS